MNKDVQIDEMARDLCEHYGTNSCDSYNCECSRYCNVWHDCATLVDKGYRKASEVIDEFEKIVLAGIEKDESFREKMHTDTDRSYFEGGANSQRKLLWFTRELKKKYIGKDTNATTKTED